MSQGFHRLLVTGGAGFVGSHLTRQLLGEGFEVTVIDDLSYGDIRNIQEMKGNKNFTFVKGDIRNLRLLKKICGDVDAVFHEAALVSVPLSVDQPRLVNDVNVNGTLALLEAACRGPVRKIVLASSCAVYGDPAALPCSEESPTYPKSLYGATKLAAELYGKVYSEVQGIPTVVLRYFNVYGPSWSRSGEETVVRSFITRLMDGKPPIVHGDGSQTRDFVYIRDVVRANLNALVYNGKPYSVFNVGTGKPTRIIDLAYKVIQVFGLKGLEPIFHESRIGDIEHSYADVGRSLKELGYTPTISLEEGLKMTVEWYKGRRLNS
ncbi:MAG: GDP-mannose 4,6-dehydratase [Candidatus Bathyarchaeia archaeon]